MLLSTSTFYSDRTRGYQHIKSLPQDITQKPRKINWHSAEMNLQNQEIREIQLSSYRVAG